MAGLTSYGAHNIVVLRDYNFTFNEVISGQPALYIKIHEPKDDPSEEEQDKVEITTWYKGQCEETASWMYVGMDYATAQSCANAMRTMLRNQQPVWEYGFYLDNGDIVLGWHIGAGTPKMESDVQVQKTNGVGSLYDVVIVAKFTMETYGKNPGLNTTGARPLADLLPHIDGFYTSNTPNGKYYDAASGENISIVAGPSYHREFTLLGADITTVIPNGQTLSGYTFPLWYKERRTYNCEVKYQGLTRTACRTLFNQLNTTSGGLWHLFHEYEYKFVKTQGASNGGRFDWQPTQQNIYQNLNEFTARPMGANLWEVSISLSQWQDYYTTTPNASFTPSWPSEWYNVPGLSTYL